MAQRPEPAGRGPAPQDRAERLLLLVLVRDPRRVEQLVELLRPEDFRGQAHRELFAALLEHDPADDIATLEVSGPARALLEELLAEEEELSDPDRSFWEQVGVIRLRPQLERLKELQELLARAEGEEQEALLRETVALKKKLQERAADLGTLGAKVSNRYGRYLKR